MIAIISIGILSVDIKLFGEIYGWRRHFGVNNVSSFVGMKFAMDLKFPTILEFAKKLFKVSRHFYRLFQISRLFTIISRHF